MGRNIGRLSQFSFLLGGCLGLSVVANVWLPPFIVETWVRDADVGLWFCAGLYLTELAIPSWIAISGVGTVARRWLLGAMLALLFIASAWLGFRFTGPVSNKDAICFLSVSCVSWLLPLVTNQGLCWLFGVRLVPIPMRASLPVEGTDSSPRTSETETVHAESMDGCLNRIMDPTHPLPERGNANEAGDWQVDVRGGGHGCSFGLASLFAWIVLAAASVSFFKHALGASDIAFRAIRITLVLESAYYTAARALYVLCLQAVILRWCWAPAGGGRVGWWSMVGLVVGFEGMRRTVSGLHGAWMSYLEWEFAPMVLGVTVGHVWLGLLLRWRGWVLQSC